MCGIYCCIHFKGQSETYSKSQNDSTTIDRSIQQLLANRGPDACSSHSFSNTYYSIFFAGQVLWQQGATPCVQPVVYKEHLLLMNGDIFTHRSNKEQSDSKWLLMEINQCCDTNELLSLFARLKGPYSIIYYNTETEILYIVRDSLGRHSLLIGKHSDDIIISSVAAKTFGTESFIELPPLGVFKFIQKNNKENSFALHPWQEINSHQVYVEQIQQFEKFLNKTILIEDQLEVEWLKNYSDVEFNYNFEDLLQNNTETKPIDIFTTLVEHINISSACDVVLKHISNSVQERVETTTKYCKKCIKSREFTSNPNPCHHPKIGILFSGGIDCTILSVLADKFVDKNEEIDLINVSFEKIKRQTQGKCNVEFIDDYNTPDRLSAKQTLSELRILCPQRKWKIVEVNVSRKELQDALVNRICHLVYPMISVLDESLGAALWFAASGKGYINGNEHYESPCRVLLIGSGADELFGGYTRHRNAFLRANSSWINLENELHLDWVRLPSRNLARDDRIIADRGITSRSPFVQEDLSRFIRNLKSYQKCYHALEQGVGDKLLLRLCGFKLGLREVCWLKKRALQFGSRVADSKQNAKDVSVVLK